MDSVYIQLRPNGSDSRLGSQFTYRAGLVFPTKGSSTLNVTTTSFNPNKHPCFPFCATHSPSFSITLSLSLSLSLSLFLRRIANPLFLFNPLIYSLRWVDTLWLSSGLTRVDGVQINYSWHEYALLRTVVMALELVPTPKRLLGNDIP